MKRLTDTLDKSLEQKTCIWSTRTEKFTATDIFCHTDNRFYLLSLLYPKTVEVLKFSLFQYVYWNNLTNSHSKPMNQFC